MTFVILADVIFAVFLQEIRKEELHLKPNEALIPVAHFHKVSQLAKGKREIYDFCTHTYTHRWCITRLMCPFC